MTSSPAPENIEKNASDLLQEYDRDSRSRHLNGPLGRIYSLLFAAFSLYILTTSLLWGSQTEYTKLPVFLGLILFLGYLKFPACKKDAARDNFIPWYDLAFAFLSLAC